MSLLLSRAMFVLLAFVAGTQATSAQQQALIGKVIRITDGDTLAIVDASHIEHRIRIAGIDAPEKGQPFSEASRQHLARLAFGKQLTAFCYKLSYRRRVCNIFVGDTDIGLEQVRAGMAWHYKRFEHEQADNNRVQYAVAEVRARSARLGLWSQHDAVAPWDWRKGAKQ